MRKITSFFHLLAITIALATPLYASAQEATAPPQPTDATTAPAATPKTAPKATPGVVVKPAAAETDGPAVKEATGPWKLYHEALDAALLGEVQRAEALLKQLRRDHITHPAGKQATLALARLEAARAKTGATKQKILREDPHAEEKPVALARAELAFLQTMHGIGLGAEMCILAECDDARVIVGALIAGGGLGLGLSLKLTEDGIKPGQSSAINSGTVWGLWHGIGLTMISEPDSFKTATSLVMASHLAGLGAGIVAYQLLEPTGGDVAVANSAGIWSTVVVTLLHGMNEFKADDKAIWTSLLIAGDLGIVGGSFLAQKYPMSRGRSLVIDAGGIVGMLIGFGLPVLILNEAPESQAAWFGSALTGTLGGLAAATYFTRSWDANRASKKKKGPSANLGLIPAKNGGLFSLHGTF